jgi:hypothetical protein
MEACVDLGGPRASPLAIHRWWFLTLVVVACFGVAPLGQLSDTEMLPVLRSEEARSTRHLRRARTAMHP